MLRSFVFSLLAVLFVVPNAALADKRVALVIGNGAYQHAEPLPNPTHDAEAIADLLRTKASFDVVLSKDLNSKDFLLALRAFKKEAEDADIALVFYAGHTIQLGNKNYLIPVDASLQLETDAKYLDQGIPFDLIVQTVERTKHLRILLLDTNGLAKVDESRLSALGDTVIAYAAKPGSVAFDGDGDHSPFTAALLEHLAEPGLDIRRILGKVRDDVRQNTRGEQEPFFYGTLGDGEFLLVPAPATP